METIKVRPVLVETKGKSIICHLTSKGKEFNDLRYLDTESPIILDSINYELIFVRLQYGKIEVGDTFLYRNYKLMTCTGLSKSGQILTNNKIPKHDDYGQPQSLCKKVIAFQSQIPMSYIKQFIEEYNAGNIKDVEIEMEEDGDCEIGGREYINYLPKLTDGFVAIVNKNDREIDVDTDTSGEFIPYSEPILYTEEEVHNLIIKFRDTLIILDKYTYSDMENWFEQNKKK